jgi:ABC-type iron transport system FetAB permease component
MSRWATLLFLRLAGVVVIAAGVIIVRVSIVLKELECVRSSLALPKLTLRACSENQDKTETYLAFGASHFEACRPLVVEGLRLSLTPVINQMRCAAPTHHCSLAYTPAA